MPNTSPPQMPNIDPQIQCRQVVWYVRFMLNVSLYIRVRMTRIFGSLNWTLGVLGVWAFPMLRLSTCGWRNLFEWLPPAGAAVRYHFLFVAVCVFACLLICRCLYVSNGLSVCISMFAHGYVCLLVIGRSAVCLSVCVCLFVFFFKINIPLLFA